VYPSVESIDPDMNVPKAGVALAIGIAVAVGVLTALLAERSGPQQVVMRGVPPDQLAGLVPARTGEGKVSEEGALAAAVRANPSMELDKLRVIEATVARVTSAPPDYWLSGRLVWLINFGDTDELGAAPIIGGGPERDYSCDWALRYGFVLATVDAESAEWLSLASGTRVDLSRPPSEYQRPVSNGPEYCKRLLEPD
jgi:hypothetical protein